MRNICMMVLCCMAALARGQMWNRSMLHLPDTGQEADFTPTPGEDSDFTLFPLSYIVHEDETLTDEVTGLMWQQQDGGEMTFEQAQAFVDSLTLAGYDDWRLPNAHELMSIQDMQQSNPSVETQAFADTDAEYWWSADAQANDPNKIWVTNAGGGIGNHPKTETISAGGTHRFHARAVRSVAPPETLTSRFLIQSNGTVIDAMTDLQWQQVAPNDTLTWEQALNYADTLSLAGYTDWRLPNCKELHSINQENIINPSVDPAWSSVSSARKWWSSTTLLNDPQKAWYLYTRFGITTYDLKSLKHSVRVVRSGEASTWVHETPQKSMHAYPNPACSQLYCSGGSNACYELYNASGRLLSSLSGCGPWNIEYLEAGMYMLRNKTTGQTASFVKN